MINAIKKLINFFKTMYLRYLLVTELYMVEEWEKVVIHIVLAMLFLVLWYFNYTIVVNGIGKVRGLSPSIVRFY